MIAVYGIKRTGQSLTGDLTYDLTIPSVILPRPRALSRATGVPCSMTGVMLRASHRLFDCRQRGIGFAAIGTAGLRHVGPAAAALAAERF
jgi:hypothetical protein